MSRIDVLLHQAWIACRQDQAANVQQHPGAASEMPSKWDSTLWHKSKAGHGILYRRKSNKVRTGLVDVFFNMFANLCCLLCRVWDNTHTWTEVKWWIYVHVDVFPLRANYWRAMTLASKAPYKRRAEQAQRVASRHGNKVTVA